MQRNSKQIADPISRKLVDVAKELLKRGEKDFSPILEGAAVTAQREIQEEQEDVVIAAEYLPVVDKRAKTLMK